MLELEKSREYLNVSSSPNIELNSKRQRMKSEVSNSNEVSQLMLQRNLTQSLNKKEIFSKIQKFSGKEDKDFNMKVN